MPVANPDPSINLETRVFQDNEALLYVPIYNKATGLYGGLTKKLALNTIRGDANEKFFSHGYSKEKSTLLFCTMKHPLPNIFHCTVFKKHHGFSLDENQKEAKYSTMFLYLPSTLDRKKHFLQWKQHVYLHSIDVSYDDLKTLNNDGDMNPALLDHKELRKDVLGCYYKMKRSLKFQTKIWFVILMPTFQMVEKLIQITNFLGSTILISKEKKNFN